MGEKHTAGLTKAQRKFLKLADAGELDTSWGHPEAQSLADLGLVTISRFRQGSAFVGGQTAQITDAGRALLAKATLTPQGES